MRVHELPARLAHWGVPYRLVAGWDRHGLEFPVRPDGALRHWTATAGEALNAIRNGRGAPNPLQGPLSQLYQSGEVEPVTGLDWVYVVASGKANHAGDGVLNGIVGNYRLLGLEIRWAGPREHFGGMRKLTSELAMRAMLDCCAGTDTNDVGEHREYARPLGRKIDTNLSGDELRARMRTITPYRPGGDFMALTEQQQKDLVRQVAELHHFLVGLDVPSWGSSNPRHNSVVTRLKYVFSEALGGDNLGEFRALLDNAIGDSTSIADLVESVGRLEDDIHALAGTTT